MRDLLLGHPLLLIFGFLGIVSAGMILAFVLMKDKKEAIGFDRTVSDREITRRLLGYVKPYTRGLLVIGLLMAVSVSYDIVNPLIVGQIEEMLRLDFSLGTLLWWVVLYAALLAVSVACGHIQAVGLQKIGVRIVSDIREQVFGHIEKLSHDQLHHHPVGQLVTRATNDTEAILTFTNIVMNMAKNCFIIVGITVAMFCVNATLAAMVMCFVPFVVLFTVIFRKFSRRAHRRVKDGTTNINIFLSENLSGMKITQLFCAEDRKLREFDRANKSLGRAKQNQIAVFSVFRPLVFMLFYCSNLCLFYLGSRGAFDGRTWLGQVITGGVVVTFYMYISKFFNPIQNLAEQFNRLQSAYASAEKIFKVLDTVPDVVDAPDAEELTEVRGDIVFDHVWFAYEGENWVLRDVSFHVAPGETAAFVGATGAGKTTILSLLCRNYDIQRGTILVDGHDIARLRIDSLRRHFGQMLQDVFLFSGTVRSNILLGLEGKTDEDVMEACRYVNADRFISRLERGIDEPILERGSNFSAGQRQMISFARTIIHRPEVMILDEATANIDTETEMLIQESLERMMNIGTMLIVAHRLSTIRRANRIFVLDHGQIIEEGTHEELLGLEGRYYALYMMQYHRDQLTRGA